MTAGAALALGTASLASADDEVYEEFKSPGTEERGGFGADNDPAYGKDPRQLMPDENPLKGVPNEMREDALSDTGALPPEYGKDPRQLMPGENPLKGIPRVKHVD